VFVDTNCSFVGSLSVDVCLSLITKKPVEDNGKTMVLIQT
jgi:hypothetical protein